MSTAHTHRPASGTEPSQEPPQYDRPRWFKSPVVWGTIVILTLFATTLAVTFYVSSRPVVPPQQLPPSPPTDPDARMAEAETSFVEGYVPAETAAYAARNVSPLTGWADQDVMDEMREQLADWRYADITATGEVTATAEAINFQEDTPREDVDTVVLDVCTDTSEWSLTLPDGSDAARGPDGSTDYLTRTQSTVTVINDRGYGADRWVVVSFETDNATPC